jgi:hypothetical protein
MRSKKFSGGNGQARASIRLPTHPSYHLLTRSLSMVRRMKAFPRAGQSTPIRVLERSRLIGSSSATGERGKRPKAGIGHGPPTDGGITGITISRKLMAVRKAWITTAPWTRLNTGSTIKKMATSRDGVRGRAASRRSVGRRSAASAHWVSSQTSQGCFQAEFAPTPLTTSPATSWEFQVTRIGAKRSRRPNGGSIPIGNQGIRSNFDPQGAV